MPRPIFSRRFVSLQGVRGVSGLVVVPTGHVYVVKTLACFAAPLVGEIRILFRSTSSGATIWHQRIGEFETDSRQLVGCHLAFEEGEGFNFQVICTAPDAADVFASGFDLTS